MRVLHATINREGTRYVQRLTDHLSRKIYEVLILIPTTLGLPYAVFGGRLATLSNWLRGAHPPSDSPCLLEDGAALLARVPRPPPISPSNLPDRTDPPTHPFLDWMRNYLFGIDTLQISNVLLKTVG